MSNSRVNHYALLEAAVYKGDAKEVDSLLNNPAENIEFNPIDEEEYPLFLVAVRGYLKLYDPDYGSLHAKYFKRYRRSENPSDFLKVIDIFLEAFPDACKNADNKGCNAFYYAAQQLRFSSGSAFTAIKNLANKLYANDIRASNFGSEARRLIQLHVWDNFPVSSGMRPLASEVSDCSSSSASPKKRVRRRVKKKNETPLKDAEIKEEKKDNANTWSMQLFNADASLNDLSVLPVMRRISRQISETETKLDGSVITRVITETEDVPVQPPVLLEQDVMREVFEGIRCSAEEKVAVLYDLLELIKQHNLTSAHHKMVVKVVQDNMEVTRLSCCHRLFSKTSNKIQFSMSDASSDLRLLLGDKDAFRITPPYSG